MEVFHSRFLMRAKYFHNPLDIRKKIGYNIYEHFYIKKGEQKNEQF